jgi:hypothetical protein
VQLAIAVTLLAVLAGCSAGTTPKATASPTRTASASSPTASPSPSLSSPSPSPSPSPSTQRPTPAKPAALPVAPAGEAAKPQTTAFPKTSSTAFRNATHDIWLALATGNADYAKPAFFPEKAYEQIKAIANPASDWTNRLWYDFTLDMAAAHKLVKPGATLVKFEVPTQYAQWVSPGACYNSAGYWHVPGARVVYRQDGTTLSFGIASFISWRGDWYLIHLGALTRGGAYGIVDDPAQGAGTPGPPGGC